MIIADDVILTWDREDSISNWRIYVNGEFRNRASMVEGMLIDQIEKTRLEDRKNDPT